MTVFFGIDQVSPLIKSRPIENNQKKKTQIQKDGHTGSGPLPYFSLLPVRTTRIHFNPAIIATTDKKKNKKNLPAEHGSIRTKNQTNRNGGGGGGDTERTKTNQERTKTNQ